MGRRGGANRAPNAAAASGSNNAISLREELTGKKQAKGGVAVNAKSALKVEHLQRLALWAGAEASVPSLGAFFGRGLASAQEALAVLPDPSVFSCQRCETILQPGFNCTVRIEQNRAKSRRRSKKPNSSTQNSVVFTCHFCSNRNFKRGTPTGHMKAICPPKTRTTCKLKPARSICKKSVNSKKSSVVEEEVRKANEIASSEIAEETQTVESHVGEDEFGKANEIASSEIAREAPPVDSTTGEDEVIIANEVASSAMAGEVPNEDIPATPVAKTETPLLLGGKRRKRNKSASKSKPADPENSTNPTDAENSASMSKKRRRKSWTSLKEIAQGSEQNKIQNIGHLTVPFFIK